MRRVFSQPKSLHYNLQDTLPRFCRDLRIEMKNEKHGCNTWLYNTKSRKDLKHVF
jgi:hypothetical protein